MTDVPRCSHGHIILGCPEDDCAEQRTYLADVNARYYAWYLSTMQSFARPKNNQGESDDGT